MNRVYTVGMMICFRISSLSVQSYPATPSANAKCRLSFGTKGKNIAYKQRKVILPYSIDLKGNTGNKIKVPGIWICFQNAINR